ncbi:MAG: dynamin family protein [Candidatus Dormibacteraeota bacterium]|nr:dynamin family protein [Candidatus Dormibacteraeota bacterium]
MDVETVPEAAPGSSLAGWSQSREQALRVLDRLAELAERRSDTAGAGRLRAARARLGAGRLNLAVLGEFKRGKSTLINRLLGAPVLPVGVVPMTSLAILVEHGPCPEVDVELASGERLRLGPQALRDYATESGNPENRRRVTRVVVRHPAPILAAGVVLVDTPGVGSAHDHNTEVAHRALAEADAAVFVLSVDSPASRAELDFLSSVRERVGRLIFVLNKADLVGAQELEEAAEFVRRMLGAPGDGPSAALFPLSAREGDLGFVTFRAHLESALTAGRAALLLQRMRGLGREGLAEERRMVALQRAAMRLSSQEARERTKGLEVLLGEVRRTAVEVEQLLHSDVNRLVPEVAQPAIEDFRAVALETLARRVRELAALGGTPRQLEDEIGELLTGLVRDWLGRTEEEVARALEPVAERHSQRANRMLAEASAQIAALFEVDLAPVSLGEEMGEASSRLVLLDHQELALEAAASGLRRLAPGRLGRRLVEREAISRMEAAVDRHCGRLRYDISTRLGRKEVEWRRQLRGALERLEATVRRAGQLAESARSEGAEAWALAVAELDQREREVELLDEQLLA